MKAGYVDTSCLVALTLGESGAKRIRRRLESMDRLVASPLAEAELRSALAREKVAGEPPVLGWIDWVMPDRPLTKEIDRALAASWLRGADLWHIACALFVAPDPSDLAFLTLDLRQRNAAALIGFARDSSLLNLSQVAARHEARG